MPPPFGPHLKRVPCPEGSCQTQCCVTAMTRPFMSPFVSPSLPLFSPRSIHPSLALSLAPSFALSSPQPLSVAHFLLIMLRKKGEMFFLAGREGGRRAASAGCARANDGEMFLSPSSYLSLYAALHYPPGPQSDDFLSPHARTHHRRSPFMHRTAEYSQARRGSSGGRRFNLACTFHRR